MGMPTDELVETIGLLPRLDSFELIHLSFTTYRSESEAGKKTLCGLAMYEKGEKRIEILVQTPKDAALENINIEEAENEEIENVKVFLNSEPKPNIFSISGESTFTWVKDDAVLTVKGTEDKELLAQVLKSENIDPEQTGLLKFTDKFPSEIERYIPVFFTFSQSSVHIVYIYPTSSEGTDIGLEISNTRFEEPESKETLTVDGKTFYTWGTEKTFYIQEKEGRVRCNCFKENEEKQKPVMEKLLLKVLDNLSNEQE
jgi:hypothetical protein